MSFTGRVAVVTGAGSGIGKAVAGALGAAGAAVALLDRDEASARGAARELEAAGARVLACVADVSRPGEVRAAASRVARELGQAEILVNNAGVTQRYRPTLDQPHEEWGAVLDVDLKGVLYCAVEFGRGMVARGRGSIVNVASITGFAGFPGRVAYSAAKAGVVALTSSLAAEWAVHGVRVNAVAPGYVRTPAIERRLAEGTHDLPALLARIPLGRLAEPEEVARAVLFLASEEANYVTGATLPVDGGWLAHGDYRSPSGR